jgi:hypothetical protein
LREAREGAEGVWKSSREGTGERPGGGAGVAVFVLDIAEEGGSIISITSDPIQDRMGL